MGVDSTRDLLNKSLKLLEYMVGEIKLGRKIVSVDKKSNKYKDLDFLIVEKLSKGSDLFD